MGMAAVKRTTHEIDDRSGGASFYAANHYLLGTGIGSGDASLPYAATWHCCREHLGHRALLRLLHGTFNVAINARSRWCRRLQLRSLHWEWITRHYRSLLGRLGNHA